MFIYATINVNVIGITVTVEAKFNVLESIFENVFKLLRKQKCIQSYDKCNVSNSNLLT